MVGKSDEGHPERLLAELFETLLVINAAHEFFLTYNREWPIDEAMKIRCCMVQLRVYAG